MRFHRETETELIALAADRSIFLEGNLIRLVESEYTDFQTYLKSALDNDKEKRKQRLEVTKQVQTQNKDLEKKAKENDRLMSELKEALEAAEVAKQRIENDLDVLQRRTQFELIGNIVQIALWVIVGVGVVVTLMYFFAMYSGSSEKTLIGNTWSNLFGILLTNSFSIIGTIMGVKYASEQKDQK
jgi:flagellar biosynthesis regulator FlaF